MPSPAVPKKMQPLYDTIVGLTDGVCTKHLNEEYRALARLMAAALCRKRPSPLVSGAPQTWACAIVYTLGSVNFLTDRSQQPYLSTADLCAAFGVGQSTTHAKAKVIKNALNTGQLDPAWTLSSRLATNPLVWMFDVGGYMLDLRMAPREVQEEAFKQGLIPFIPADKT